MPVLGETCLVRVSVTLLNELPSDFQRALLVIVSDLAVDHHLPELILDDCDPAARFPVERGHQFVAIEWTLQLIERGFFADAFNVLPQSLIALSGVSLAMRPGAGHVRGGEVEQVIEFIADFNHQSPDCAVCPGLVIPGGAKMQFHEPADALDEVALLGKTPHCATGHIRPDTLVPEEMNLAVLID